MKTIKPIADRLSNCGYDIVYRCGKCGYDFAMAHEGYDYCPHCGRKIDWGVISEVNEEWKISYYAAGYTARKDALKAIDAVNLSIRDGKRHQMEQTELTRRAITISNIGYYVGEGWSTRELVNKCFFTEEEIEMYERSKQGLSVTGESSKNG